MSVSAVTARRDLLSRLVEQTIFCEATKHENHEARLNGSQIMETEFDPSLHQSDFRVEPFLLLDGDGAKQQEAPTSPLLVEQATMKDGHMDGWEYVPAARNGQLNLEDILARTIGREFMQKEPSSWLNQHNIKDESIAPMEVEAARQPDRPSVVDGNQCAVEWSTGPVESAPLEKPPQQTETDTFIAGLPHITHNLEEAFAFGRPYLPDQEKVDTVERFWAKDGRKKKYLWHLRGNPPVSDFIHGSIGSTVCVGLLRSTATEYGCRPVLHLAQMADDTVRLEDNQGEGVTNSFCVNREKLLASMRLDDGGNPLAGQPCCTKRPESLHPVAEANSNILAKMMDVWTKCVTLDWRDASEHVTFVSSRNVCALTNLICAIILPAYTYEEVLALNGEVETAVLNQYSPAIVSDESKDAVDEMCVMAAINTLVQYFSGPNAESGSGSLSKHLFNAPLRLPPFDEHPVINLKGCEFFYPKTARRGALVASLSAPAQSSVTLKHRHERKPKKLLCESDTGVQAHILPSPIGNKTKMRNRTAPSKEMQKKRRDPFIHMKKEDRPLFLRNVLALAGNYGWFGLVAGYMPSPDVLFAESNCDGLFPSHWIRRYRKRAVGDTPVRDRTIDLRFYGMELVETPGYTSCFRIRPASLCNSNNMFCHRDDKVKDTTWVGNVVLGTDNPFYTRMGLPRWYAADSMRDIFGTVDLQDHVAVFDNAMGRFSMLVEGKNRWRANLDDKLAVLERCIFALATKLDQLARVLRKKHGKKNASSIRRQVHTLRGAKVMTNSSNDRRRRMCNAAEIAITNAAQEFFGQCNEGKLDIRAEDESEGKLSKEFDITSDTLSICYMFVDECSKHKQRFLHGECRVAAQDLYKQLYRVSARRYIKNMLIRGLKSSVTWRRPFDKNAMETLANVPRCRIPQLVDQLEKKTGGELLPSLQILNTRDVNPEPIHHTLLELVCGKRVAEDISAINCLEWLNWCNKTQGEASFKAVATHIVNSKYGMNGNSACKTSRKRGKRHGGMSDAEVIHSLLQGDESTPVYAIAFPKVAKSLPEMQRGYLGDGNVDAVEERQGIKNNYKLPFVASNLVGERTNCSRPPSFFGSTSMATGDPSPIPSPGVARRKFHSDKMSTGRIGHKDVYAIALTSFPDKLSEVCRVVSNDMNLELPHSWL